MTQNEWHFWKWLNDHMTRANITPFGVARDLGVSYRLVRKHLAGQRPFFKDIICYCWLFGESSDMVLDIWDKVKVEYDLTNLPIDSKGWR